MTVPDEPLPTPPLDDLTLRAIIVATKRHANPRQVHRALLQATEDLTLCSAVAWERRRSDGVTAEQPYVDLERTRFPSPRPTTAPTSSPRASPESSPVTGPKDSLSLRSNRPWSLKDIERRLHIALLHYSYVRPHTSLGALTPIEAYYGIRRHLPQPVSAPRGRLGDPQPEVPFDIAYLDPDNQAFPILLPRAA